MSRSDPEQGQSEDTPEGDLPTRPAGDARPGEDPGVADEGGPTDPEHPSG